jgi:hypothetical protein
MEAGHASGSLPLMLLMLLMLLLLLLPWRRAMQAGHCH